MKNFVAHGDTVTITAAAAVLSGAGVLQGSLFGVATTDIAAGAEGVIALTGTYNFAKAPSQAWSVGALIYWDAANNRCTNVAGSLKLIGVCVAPVSAGAGDVVGTVRLNGCAVN